MKDRNDILDGMMTLSYEIEGLLLLVRSRGAEATADICGLIKEKTADLAGLAQSLTADGTPGKETLEAHAATPEPVKPVDERPAPDSPMPQTPAPAAMDTTTATLTLDERLACERARDITKAFTINDRFRYNRTLFHDSPEEFDETLNIIAGMTDFDEAEEYFYNDLCWDPDDEDVKGFMETVRRHF